MILVMSYIFINDVQRVHTIAIKNEGNTGRYYLLIEYTLQNGNKQSTTTFFSKELDTVKEEYDKVVKQVLAQDQEAINIAFEEAILKN
jgi:hypothetical protein